MARSLKKGPFADQSLLKKVDAMNAAGDKSVIKTWLVVHNFPILRWTYNRCSRRKKTCSGICYRRYGWT